MQSSALSVFYTTNLSCVLHIVSYIYSVWSSMFIYNIWDKKDFKSLNIFCTGVFTKGTKGALQICGELLSRHCLIIIQPTSQTRDSYSSTFVSQLTSGKLAPGYLHKCLLVPLLSLNKWIAGVAKGGRKTCTAIWPTLSYMQVREGTETKMDCTFPFLLPTCIYIFPHQCIVLRVTD